MTMSGKAREMIENLRETVDLSRCDHDPCGEYARSLRTRDGLRVRGVFKYEMPRETLYFVVALKANGGVISAYYSTAGYRFLGMEGRYDLVVAPRGGCENE